MIDTSLRVDDKLKMATGTYTISEITIEIVSDGPEDKHPLIDTWVHFYRTSIKRSPGAIHQGMIKGLVEKVDGKRS